MKVKYHKTIGRDLQKEVIIEEDVARLTRHERSLPQYKLTNDKKLGRTRQVHNASCNFKGIYLNLILLTERELLINNTAIVKVVVKSQDCHLTSQPRSKQCPRQIMQYSRTTLPTISFGWCNIFDATDSSTNTTPTNTPVWCKSKTICLQATELIKTFKQDPVAWVATSQKLISKSKQFLWTIRENHIRNNQKLTSDGWPLERIPGFEWKSDKDIFSWKQKKFRLPTKRSSHSAN